MYSRRIQIVALTICHTYSCRGLKLCFSLYALCNQLDPILLTEISENDLLNVTTDNSETLPKNSAALESAIPVTDSALPNNNTDAEKEETAEELPEDGEENTEEDTQEPETEQTTKTDNPMGTYIVIGVLAVLGIGAGYYFKVAKGKKEEFLDEDDDEEDEEETIEDDEEDEDTEEDFFNQNDEEDE